MTGVIITFVSNNVINIANASGDSITFNIAKLLSTGVFNTADQLIIANNDNSNFTINSMGLYKVSNSISGNGNTIIIANDATVELEKDVKEILLSDNIDKILPSAYDFVSLVLLSIMFVGNSPYQNAEYNSNYLTLYTAIAEAIDRCSNYLDRQVNTPQSTNKTWQ
jgi:hypothetical protein